ncbi:hypothetical protein [Deinococcus navajonensis]|uniref:Uncharacterized protein n=1 Tax=Deinococcus navajonensis TaxID=309884 RepID=A0ABV8XMU0_9DEIO
MTALTGLLLASCDLGRKVIVDPVDPAATAPAAPVTGQSKELGALPAALGPRSRWS